MATHEKMRLSSSAGGSPAPAPLPPARRRRRQRCRSHGSARLRGLHRTGQAVRGQGGGSERAEHRGRRRARLAQALAGRRGAAPCERGWVWRALGRQVRYRRQDGHRPRSRAHITATASVRLRASASATSPLSTSQPLLLHARRRRLSAVGSTRRGVLGVTLPSGGAPLPGDPNSSPPQGLGLGLGLG